MSNCCKKLAHTCVEVKSILLRRFESEDHAERWKDYENLLMIRGMIAIGSRIVLSFLTQMSGSGIISISEEYLDDEDRSQNSNLAIPIHPYVKMAYITYLFGRILLFIAGFKWPNLIIKIGLQYELLFFVFSGCMPYEISKNKEIHITSMGILLIVFTNHHELVPTLISAVIALIPVFVKRALFFGDKTGGLVIAFLIQLLYVTVNVFIVHLILTKIGLIYVDSVVLRQGKDETLDNLKEGVIILSEKDLSVKYFNKAASVLESDPAE